MSERIAIFSLQKRQFRPTDSSSGIDMHHDHPHKRFKKRMCSKQSECCRLHAQLQTVACSTRAVAPTARYPTASSAFASMQWPSKNASA